MWLTPEQFIVLPISEKFLDYAFEVSQLLDNYDIRGLVDVRNEKAGRKIRDAEIQKIPFMLVVGEKELETNSVAVRKHGHGDLGSMSIEAFAELVKQTIAEELSRN